MPVDVDIKRSPDAVDLVVPDPPTVSVINPGADVGILYAGPKMDTTPPPPPWTTPTVQSWTAYSQDNGGGVITQTKLQFYNCVTGGSPARISWRIKSGKFYSFSTAYSYPEQNSPHIGDLTVTNPLAVRKWYDLYADWTSDGHSGSIFVGAGLIYIVGPGDGDWNGSG